MCGWSPWSSSGMKQSSADKSTSVPSFLLDSQHALGALLFTTVLFENIFCTFSLSHCNGLSNTESGRMEIFSFFSGQLYSLGNFDWTEGGEKGEKKTREVRQQGKLKVKLKAQGFLITSSWEPSSCKSPSICSTNSSVSSIYVGRRQTPNKLLEYKRSAQNSACMLGVCQFP